MGLVDLTLDAQKNDLFWHNSHKISFYFYLIKLRIGYAGRQAKQLRVPFVLAFKFSFAEEEEKEL